MPAAPDAAAPMLDALEERARPAAAVWRRLRHGIAGKGVLSLFDQVLVSGTSFVATILIGRVCGPEELGIYSLAFTLLVIVVCVQQSLLMTPYSIFVNRLRGREEQEFSGSVFVQQNVLALVSVASLAAAALVFSQVVGPRGLASTTAMLALMMPAILLREFARRYSFAHFQLISAILLDGACSMLLLAGLGLLILFDAANPLTAFAVIGGACGITGVIWFLRRRSKFVIVRRNLIPQFLQSWSIGRWVFAAQVTFLIHSYVSSWMLAAMLDTAATGIFSACMTIVYLSNPFIQGVGNILNPWISRAYAAGGGAALRRAVGQASLLFGGAMGLFFLALLACGDFLLCLFFGEEFAGNQPTITVLAASAWVSALATAPGNGLWVMETPKATFVASLVGISITLAVGPLLIRPYGPLGGACALLAGNLAGTALVIYAFDRRSRELNRNTLSAAEEA